MSPSYLHSYKKIYRLMYQQIMKHSENVLPSQDSCSLFALSLNWWNIKFWVYGRNRVPAEYYDSYHFVEVHQAFTGPICRGSKIPFIITELPKFTTLTLHLSIPASVSSCSTVVQSSIYDSNSFVLEMYGFYVQSLNFRANCCIFCG